MNRSYLALRKVIEFLHTVARVLRVGDLGALVLECTAAMLTVTQRMASVYLLLQFVDQRWI